MVDQKATAQILGQDFFGNRQIQSEPGTIQVPRPAPFLMPSDRCAWMATAAMLLVLAVTPGETAWSGDQIPSFATLEPGSASRPKPKLGLLVLKGARTGSTWFCLELNRRGAHISQEALLHWERAARATSSSPARYLTRGAREAWVSASLLRPMPKNPFVLQLSSAQRHKRRSKLSKGSLSRSCVPLFDQPDACSDWKGCHQFSNYQKTCFRTAEQELQLVGISYSFRSDVDMSLGTDTFQNGETWPRFVARQMASYDVVLSSAKRHEVPVLVLAQTRSNIVRWRISQTFHEASEGRHGGTKHSKHALMLGTRGSTLRITDPVRFFLSSAGAQKALENVLLALRVSKRALCILYEDIGRNVSEAIDQLLKGTGVVLEKPSEETVGTRNTQDQHLHPVSHYIANFDQVQTAMQAYPCYRKQLIELDKTVSWTLPLRRDGTGALRIDHNLDCCKMPGAQFVRSVSEYIAMSLACTAR